jgi:hypothetical protein
MEPAHEPLDRSAQSAIHGRADRRSADRLRGEAARRRTGTTEAGAWDSLAVTTIQTAAQEVKHLEELERAGESEWTPWIAIAGLILFFAAVGLLMFGIIEGTSQLFLSVEPWFS